ncbi:MAG: hypothetical protein EBU33_11010, partial [Sphingobacteriia bacterium]|nr:hypothetical protein [Sphingobacteriia bacterium]
QLVILQEILEKENILIRQNLLGAEETNENHLLAGNLGVLRQKILLGLGAMLAHFYWNLSDNFRPDLSFKKSIEQI